MYRFFVEENQIDHDKIYIRGNDVNHIRNVLRMKPGKSCVSAPETTWNTGVPFLITRRMRR
jgi:16S rRNA U1498 N3-methylase RsmE